MNWDDMRYFLALAREKQLSAAARQLGVNHVTVARRVKSLEQNLQSRLFTQHRSGFELTASGEDLLSHALEAEQVMQAANLRVAGRDAEQRGTITVTVPGPFAQRVVMPRIAEFRATYPNLDLTLLSTESLVNMAAREADIALRLTDNPPDYLVGRPLLALKHGLYASEEYLTRSQTPHDVILYTSERGVPQWLVDYFGAPKIALRVDDVSAMHQAVRCHLGVARLPCFMGDSDPALRRLDYVLPPSSYSVWLLNHIELRDARRIRICRQFLTDAVMQAANLILGEGSHYI